MTKGCVRKYQRSQSQLTVISSARKEEIEQGQN